jgi:ribosomal protein L11 methylase PrmA
VSPKSHANPTVEDFRERSGDKTVLDAGCGDGWFSVILAKRGAASVNAFDISGEAVRLAKTRARVNGVSDCVKVKKASIYVIPAADR